MMRASAYCGSEAPIASTSMAVIGTWFAVPGVSLSAHARSTETTTARRTIQLFVPNARPIR